MGQNNKFVHNTIRTRFSMILFVLLTAGIPLGAQTGILRDCGCQILDKAYDALYIRFERTSLSTEKGKPERLIWLRLRNNTSCSVYLDMIGLYYRLVDGKAVNDALDGQELQLHYIIESESGREANYRTDQFGRVTLFSGCSIIFSVANRHFKKKNIIAVPFQYTWESSGVVPNPRCEVLYRTDSLPSGWDKIEKSPSAKPDKKQEREPARGGIPA